MAGGCICLRCLLWRPSLRSHMGTMAMGISPTRKASHSITATTITSGITILLNISTTMVLIMQDLTFQANLNTITMVTTIGAEAVDVDAGTVTLAMGVVVVVGPTRRPGSSSSDSTSSSDSESDNEKEKEGPQPAATSPRCAVLGGGGEQVPSRSGRRRRRRDLNERRNGAQSGQSGRRTDMIAKWSVQRDRFSRKMAKYMKMMEEVQRKVGGRMEGPRGRSGGGSRGGWMNWPMFSPRGHPMNGGGWMGQGRRETLDGEPGYYRLIVLNKSTN